MRIVLPLIAVFLTLACVWPVAAAEAPVAATPALKKCRDAVAAADAERARAVDKARAQLVTELKVAQKAALQNNDVDGATAMIPPRHFGESFRFNLMCSSNPKLTESEITVRDAIRELYAGHITSEEIEIDGTIKYLVLHFAGHKLVIKLSKLAGLYEGGTSLAAIKTASQFDLTDPSRLPWGK